MIKIESYAKSKNNGGGSASSGVGRGFANNTVEKELDTHLLWGQPFNGTQDVDGDISTSGGINAVDNITTQGDMAASTATFNTISSTNINNTDTIITSTLSATNTATTTLNADNGDIKTLLSDNITTDFLTVTKSAHFWHLIIDKISSSNGAVILSPAHAKVEEVTAENNKYTLFWKAEDKDTGKKISNDFSVGDQILCQTFNTATGTEYNKSNKYYWAVVDGKGTTEKTDTLSNEITSFHHITITKSVNTYDGDSVPSAGDEIVVLGNRQNAERQNAIILSATNGDYLDGGLKAPYIAQYKGIKTFEFEPYRYNFIAANGNIFIGNFKVVNADGSVENIKNGEKGDNATFNRLVAEYATLEVDEIGDVILKAKIYVAHTDGHVTTTLNDISAFGFDVSTKNGGNTYTVTSGKNYFQIEQVLQSGYYDIAESERVEYCRIRLNENGVLTDTLLINNTVTNSALFDVKNDAITAAVKESNGYTDTKTGEIKLATDNISLKLSTVNYLRNHVVGSAFRTFDVPYRLINSKYPVTIQENGVGGSKFCRISAAGATTTSWSGIYLDLKGMKSKTKYVASIWVRPVKDIDDNIYWRLNIKSRPTATTNTLIFNQNFEKTYGEWKLYTISFTTPLVFSSMWLEICCKKNGVMDICRPMVEEGTEYNGYTLSQYDVNIDGKLKETGIDISNGQITLNATNTIVEGNLALYGTLRRKPTYINKANINKYVVYDGENSWYFSDTFWQEGGCYVVFENGCFEGKGTGAIVGYLPSLGAETAGQTEKNNMARSLVGAAITVYNNSGIDIAFSGRCYSAEKSGAGYGKLPSTFNSPPIANGRCGHFMCCLGAVNDIETIAWMYSTMKTVQ